MVDYQESSQLHNWLFQSEEELMICRARANYETRVYIARVREDQKQRQQRKQQQQQQANNNSKDESSSTQQPPKDGSDVQSEDNQQQSGSSSSTSSTISTVLPISHFACDPNERKKSVQQHYTNESNTFEFYTTAGPWEDCYGKKFVTYEQECIIQNFYISKLGSIIGPNASIPRLRRESKVLATAALFYKRFYISNSILLFDPKLLIVAAAFLASKVEDVTADIRNLEEATVVMNAPVTIQQIVQSEIYLLSGIHFYLLCFHPYKTVVALTEDLRTFYKTSTGKRLLKTTTSSLSSSTTTTTAAATASTSGSNSITGQDLKPIYDTARSLLDDVVISDLPLLYTPGQIGLASLIAAQKVVLEQYNSVSSSNATQSLPPPTIDFMGYVKERFPKGGQQHSKTTKNRTSLSNNNNPNNPSHDNNDTYQWLPSCLGTLTEQILDLKNGKYGCSHYVMDLSDLKKVHKQLKKVRMWTSDDNNHNNNNNNNNNANDDNDDDNDNAKKKKKKDKKSKKSNNDETVSADHNNDTISNNNNNGDTNGEPSTKRTKL